ncbi:MAG: NADP-dependent malic enzyme [Candidatus Moraniibacteriota bacterium]
MASKSKSLEIHKKHKGKIEIKPKFSISSKEKLSLAYTPGVAEVSKEIAKNKKMADVYTNKANQVAIVSDGTAVLGLGDIGPEAGLPVMEGKAAIFKSFAEVDAVPLCVDTTDVDEIVKFCKQIQPNFAGINLEDISAPRCFEVLDKLEKELSIPVFHDDQDGTAIVTVAALMNALKIVNKKKEEIKIVINGAGAAGIAIAKLLYFFGIKKIFLLDSKGTITTKRKDLTEVKKNVALLIGNKEKQKSLEEAVAGADVFIGVSKEGLLKKSMVKSMKNNPIIFAMANPVPEIMPKEAKEAGAAVMGTGRSDFANQINNALVFPGIFRGLFDSGKSKVTQQMKVDIAKAVAGVVKKPNKSRILPAVTDKKVVKTIAKAVEESRG